MHLTSDDIHNKDQDEKISAEDLPNLAKSTFYMRDFKHSRDIYSQVHAKSMNMLYEGRVPKEIFDSLS